jgi:hypothetical protein
VPDFVRFDQIIRIKVLDEFACSMSAASVPCSRRTIVDLFDQPKVRAGEGTNHFGAAIRRSIIDYDDLDIRPGLAENRLQRLAYVFLGIVARNQD